MDARREPRFSIYGSVKVTLLSSPDRVLECVLLDISATGLKLIAPESFAPDEILSIEAEDHLALAEVRYSQARGDKFTIGCERIHLLNKEALPGENSKVEQIRLLVEDYRNRMRGGIATPRPDTNGVEAAQLSRQIMELPKPAEKDPPKPEQPPTDAQPPIHPGLIANRGQLLDAAVAWVLEHWEKIPPSPTEAVAGRSETIDRLTLHLAEQLHAREPSEVPANQRPPIEKIAAKKKPGKNLPRWRLPAGLAVAAVLGWGLSALFWSLGSSGAAGRLPSTLTRLISPQEPPQTVSASSTRHVQIKAVEPTWVMATSDGKRLFNKKLAKDDIRNIEFSDKAVLRIGNAKGVEISLDGKLIGPFGGRGQTRVVELSAKGFRLLALNP